MDPNFIQWVIIISYHLFGAQLSRLPEGRLFKLNPLSDSL